MKRELDLAELFARKPAAKHFADPGKNRAEDQIVFQRDLREHHAHRRIRLIPTHDVGFTRRALQRGENVEQNPAVLFRRLSAPRVHEQQDKWTLRTLAALPFQRDHPAEDLFVEDFFQVQPVSAVGTRL